MELGQSVFRWGVFLPYRFLGVDSFHLRGDSSFWSFFSFWGCSHLVYSLYALWRLAFSNAYLVYLSKKKKKVILQSLGILALHCYSDWRCWKTDFEGWYFPGSKYRAISDIKSTMIVGCMLFLCYWLVIELLYCLSLLIRFISPLIWGWFFWKIFREQ